jgi:hypothetical protein
MRSNDQNAVLKLTLLVLAAVISTLAMAPLPGQQPRKKSETPITQVQESGSGGVSPVP